mmetsp:Transcript_4025/g.11524  ORF Transcript_4025/g.11524 Transcript_4025/m.11524 type:complete len:312 (-) Transcript_4025:1116-2051(-)
MRGNTRTIHIFRTGYIFIDAAAARIRGRRRGCLRPRQILLVLFRIRGSRDRMLTFGATDAAAAAAAAGILRGRRRSGQPKHGLLEIGSGLWSCGLASWIPGEGFRFVSGRFVGVSIRSARGSRIRTTIVMSHWRMVSVLQSVRGQSCASGIRDCRGRSRERCITVGALHCRRKGSVVITGCWCSRTTIWYPRQSELPGGDSRSGGRGCRRGNRGVVLLGCQWPCAPRNPGSGKRPQSSLVVLVLVLVAILVLAVGGDSFLRFRDRADRKELEDPLVPPPCGAHRMHRSVLAPNPVQDSRVPPHTMPLRVRF